MPGALGTATTDMLPQLEVTAISIIGPDPSHFNREIPFIEFLRILLFGIGPFPGGLGIEILDIFQNLQNLWARNWDP